MLCWVRPHEKKELIEEIKGRFPVVFAKNFDDFKGQIQDGDYLVMSITKVRCGKKVFELVRQFPDNRFNLYIVGPTEFFPCLAGLLMNEPNVTDGQYNAQEIVDNYLGVIPDLWEYRKHDDPHKYRFIFNEDGTVKCVCIG